MLTLLKAEDILNLGLTCTQVFYLVGKKASKGLCRFVKTDAIHTAIATLLSIKGKRVRVEDIRLTDFGGIKIFTSQGIETLPSSEVRAFLTRYNQLSLNGCNSECGCDDMWKQFCIHRIAEHLTSVEEKVKAVVETVKTTAAAPSIKVQHLISEAKYYLNKENLIWFESEDEGDFLLKVCQADKTELGHIIVTGDGQINILSALPGSREVEVKAVLSAIARLKGAMRPPAEPGTQSGFSKTKSQEYSRVRAYCSQTYGAGTLWQN